GTEGPGERNTGEQVLGEPPVVYGSDAVRSSTDTGEAIRRMVLFDENLPRPFSIGDLREMFPEVSTARIRSTLQTLKREGRVESVGAGRAARWRAL
ncbi:MAG: hypothetical protein R6U25_08595, partial [Alkalispirochaeta sp.]